MSNETAVPIEIAKIVHEKPPSGDFEEVLFGTDRGNTLWVYFSDRDGVSEWIGKFGCGFSPSMRVTKVIEPDRFMIVAGGFAYLVNATSRELLNQHSEAYTQDIVYDPIRNQFVSADVRLRIIENGQETWSSSRISIDDIHNLKIEDRILSGTSIVGYNGEEGSFAFNLDTRGFISGPDFSSWDAPAPPKPAKKSWWRFW